MQRPIKNCDEGSPPMTTPLEVKLALGRIFKIMSRPYKAGDEREYFRCRDIIMAGAPAFTDYAPNWARDHSKGAQGG